VVLDGHLKPAEIDWPAFTGPKNERPARPTTHCLAHLLTHLTFTRDDVECDGHPTLVASLTKRRGLVGRSFRNANHVEITGAQIKL